MIAPGASGIYATAGFRAKLFGAVMLVVLALTALGIYLAKDRITAIAERDLRRNFEDQLSGLHRVQDLRRAVLAERCRALAANPRIHAALEDDALDLLYPSANDELRDLVDSDDSSPEHATRSLHAKFYRFLDSKGAVIAPPNSKDLGVLSPPAQAQLALKHLPRQQQVGYILHGDSADRGVDEVAVAPIFSSQTGEVISALVVGFKPFELAGENAGMGMKSGIWVNGQLDLPSLAPSAQAAVVAALARAIPGGQSQGRFTIPIGGGSYLVFYERLYADSPFPPAYEICLYPLADSIAQLHRVWWQVGAAGVFLLLVGLAAASFVAARFSRPVQLLAVDSERNRAQRSRAEAALASTSKALQRSARYSADASHQLKNPVAVLRAGIEKLLACENFTPEVYEELSALLHQTYRLTGMIDDLLLLSRMDAGRLEINLEPVNLNRLMEGWLDDLSALPDSPEVTIEKNASADVYVAGEERYASLIVQNLLENAQKYNRPGGRIAIDIRREADQVVLTIGNTGRAIARDEQAHVFERFHRCRGGSDVPGNGLGLNLARELARLHGGDLKLVRSQDDWTEFELRLDAAMAAPGGIAEAARSGSSI